jgi:multidrug efflux system membrane fusion protein
MGVSDAGMVAVEGLHAGDEVANSSFEKLQDGAKVAISTMPLPSTSSETGAP